MVMEIQENFEEPIQTNESDFLICHGKDSKEEDIDSIKSLDTDQLFLLSHFLRIRP